MPTIPKRKKMYWEGSRPSAKPMSEAYILRRAVYKTYRWAQLSKRFLVDNPLCAECKRNGKVTPATESGHIIPVGICVDPFDTSNLEPTCKPCNVKKAKHDKKLFH